MAFPRALLPLILLLSGVLTFSGCGDGAEVDPCYEALEQVDPVVLAELRRHWPEGGSVRFLDDEEQEALFRVVRRTAADTPLALLKLLTERRAGGSVSTGFYFRDEEQEPLGWHLAARQDPSLNPVLIAMVEDDALHVESRRAAAIALCWPGNESALVPLVDRVLDTGEQTDLREQIIYRLPRIDRPLPERLKGLLYLPFRRLDRLVAAALACVGDLEAPSVLREALSEPVGSGSIATHVFALDGLEALFESEEDREEIKQCRADLTDPEGVSITITDEVQPGNKAWNEAFRKGHAEQESQQTARVSEVARRFEEWLTEDEARTASPYERQRDEYLASDRRAREQERESLVELLETPGDPPDFASASLTLSGWSGENRNRILWRLFVIAGMVGGRLTSSDSGEARLAALDACLLPRQVHSIRYSEFEPGGSSFLPGILDEHHGSRLGLVNLYLSVAERAEIPLHVVLVGDLPRVRYREGDRTWQLDPTSGADQHTFASAAWKPLPPDDPEPVALSSRQVLSILRSRQAELARRLGKIRMSRALADGAIRLWERNGQAHRVRLLATYALDINSDAAVLTSIRIAEELPLFGGTANVDIANVLLGLRQWEKAYRAYGALLREHPKLTAATAMQACCLTMMGRAAEARTELDALLEKAPGSLALRALRLQALVALGDPGWRSELDEVDDPLREPTLHLMVAGALLSEIPGREPAPTVAITVLDEIAGLAGQELSDRRSTGLLSREEAEAFLRDGSPPDPLADSAPFRNARRSYFLLRADALRLAGNHERALEALRQAEKLGDEDRDILRLRKKLRPK